MYQREPHVEMVEFVIWYNDIIEPLNVKEPSQAEEPIQLVENWSGIACKMAIRFV